MAIAIGLFTVLFEYGKFLTFPGTRPVLWLLVMLLCPLFS
jgi:hypothetical protein